MFETLNIEKDGPIGRLTLNSPEKLNALSRQRLIDLIDAARWFDQQPEIKVVIIKGEGRAFSAGADLSGFAGSSDISPRDGADLGRRMADALEDMKAISIAAIQGWCVGGALVLASACDLRIATTDARFSIPEIDLGIPLAWGGIPRLVREIGPALTKELVITCRPFDAAEAKSAGFLNRIVEPAQLAAEVEALAHEVAKRPTNPVQITKRHVNAVTAQMVGTMRAWSDADGLLASYHDPESEAARQIYLKQRGK
ncbi:MAG: enoyl-CoA hydratase/carnithine racemase [Cellvibrionaceae bacterium]|jgi:enoyl-CoA hydratase/carnithine racemase